MRTFFTLLILSLSVAANIHAQDWKPHDLQTTGGPVLKVPPPLNQEDMPSVFVNVNISQNSAPQNEPSVFISKKNPSRVVAAWRDFRYGIDPNANRRVGYSYSTNGGTSWSVPVILDSMLLPGLTRNSDPVVVADTAGNFYIAVIAISPSGSNLTLALYKSTNAGVTFPLAYIAQQAGSEDKEWITCDLNTTSPYCNTLYISWTRFAGGNGIRLTKSTNGGVNWSTPSAISDITFNVQGSNLCISPNGQVNVVWLQYGSPNMVRYDRSTNGGTTFGTDITVSSAPGPSGLPNNVGSFPSIAVDRSGGPRYGYLYTVFSDNRNGDADVFLSRSTDNGLTWSAPARINDDPLSNGKIQYWPWVAVNNAGKIAVLYMDSRNTPNNTIIEAYLARSSDGGVTFTNELLSTAQSPTNIPGSNVRFGDYICMDYWLNRIVPVWTDERAGGFDMEIYTAVIDELAGIEPVAGTTPDRFSLGQNYPNPFNPVTNFELRISNYGFVNLKVYDSRGREVSTLLNGNLAPGVYNLKFDGSAYPSGVYFYRMTAGDFSDTKKMIIIK